jgi:hypothetical protein
MEFEYSGHIFGQSSYYLSYFTNSVFLEPNCSKRTDWHGANSRCSHLNFYWSHCQWCHRSLFSFWILKFIFLCYTSSQILYKQSFAQNSRTAIYPRATLEQWRQWIASILEARAITTVFHFVYRSPRRDAVQQSLPFVVDDRWRAWLFTLICGFWFEWRLYPALLAVASCSWNA